MENDGHEGLYVRVLPHACQQIMMSMQEPVNGPVVNVPHCGCSCWDD